MITGLGTGEADILETLGRFKDALESYDKALLSKPTDYWAWCQRGSVLRQLERYEEAIASYDKALETRPDDYWAWYPSSVTLRELE
jgi:tetratricopeptide (TPR) repeat protein